MAQWRQTPLIEMSIPLGKHFGHYEILSQLGVGGMGEVYLARDTLLDRSVALKFLPLEISGDQNRLRRFVQEAKAASALSHPNIAHIYEIGDEDGVRFIAMEYVDGRSLDQKIGGRPMSTATIVRLAIGIADALSEAHSKGIVHRDIKSSNIMLTLRDQIKVLDFGLAKVTTKSTASQDLSTQLKTGPGVVIGTVPYMSPEQAVGQEVDYRSDIFSLGVVLYEMTTGKLPFSGRTPAETISRITGAQPDAVARFNYDAPIELDRIIRKCLEKDRERRYQSTSDLVVDLRNLERDSHSDQLPRTTTIKPKKWLSKTAIAVLAMVVLLLTLTALYVLRRDTRGNGSVNTTNIASIAVLPFVNANGDQNNEYLSDGITESMINSLSQIPRLRVMARSTMFRYKGQNADPTSVGHELHVDSVLTGRVLRQADTLVIQADLVNVADGSQIWGEHYTRKAVDVFAIQDEIARQISDRLRMRLSGDEQKLLTKHYTDNTEAYDLYLKGTYFDGKGTEEGLDKAIQYYQQAIALDPNYALAYVGMANSYASLGGVLGFRSPMETYPKTREFALKALALDERLAEAHGALALHALSYEWNWNEAERQFQRAIELNPNYADAHRSYGTYLEALGRFDEAVNERQLAQKSDPLSPGTTADVGYPLYYARKYDEAIEHYRKGLELDPKFSWSHLWIGQAYVQKGMYKEGIEEINQAIQLSGGDIRARATLGHAYALSGRRDEALKILDELQTLSRERYVSPFFIALVYAGLGDNEKTIAWLEKALNERQPYLILMKVEPVFDRLHSHPGFQAIEKRVGLTP